MAKNRRALGKGLDALIPAVEETASAGVAEISLADIAPNPFQPRAKFDKAAITELAESIKESGLCQPVVVSADSKGFILINGERRLRAFKELGRKKIPAIIREASESEMRTLAIIENIQREDLNEIEEAHGYEELIKASKLSHDDIAKKVGKSRSAITNLLRLLKLPPAVREKLISQKLSMGHARALLSLKSEKEIIGACNQIIKKNLSVREAEVLVKEVLSGGQEKRRTKSKSKAAANKIDPNQEAIREELRYTLGTQVNIKEKSSKGKIEIEYYSSEDFSRICDIILKKKA